MKERDAQVCENLITETRGPADISGWQPGDPTSQQYGKRCCSQLVREEIPASVNLDSKGSFQFGIDFGNGVVEGHLNKTARKKGPRYVKP